MMLEMSLVYWLSITRLLEDDTSSCSEGRESPLTSGEGVGVTVIVDSEEATDIEDTLGETQNKMTDSTDAVEEVCVGQLQGSPRGHVRTPSDVSAAQEEKQSHPNTDKKSVKTILSQLLPSTSGTAALQLENDKPTKLLISISSLSDELTRSSEYKYLQRPSKYTKV
uniref:Uncharacterized protein n=1 Tax=Timema poppense TaxID=170557 RepID=A0A7R9CKI8_TIMPO|nr:unnamed protein product [Timema poppensis]